ncbi:MAG: hypothetical protein WEB78_11840 [Ilumatobacteraceae bacterium]
MSEVRRGRVGAVVAGTLVILGLVTAGVFGSSGPSSTPVSVDRSRAVVIVSVPGLRWQDLEATDTPHLDRWLRGTALLSVRAIGNQTSLSEGYLTVGSGNRVEAPHTDVVAVVDGRCVPALATAATAAADDDLNGAEPGALGAALADAGIATSVFGGPEAIAALMDRDGCVGTFSTSPPPTVIPAGVSLVEFDGLERTDVAAERTALIVSFDSTIATFELADDALVVVVAPAAVDDGAEVLVAATRDGDAAGTDRSLVSPTTRRADYVTLADVAPTVLAALDIDAPEAMNGTIIAMTAPPGGSDADRVGHLADLAERVSFRDRAVTPVSVVMVVLIVLCGVAALGHRGRVARTLAPIVVAYPSIVFLSGLTQYHQLPLGAYVVMVVVAAMVLASVVVSTCSRWGSAAALTVLCAMLWTVLVVDVVTGGRLQINTPLGYTPTIAGRFQGFGNLSFGLVGSASVATAMAAAVWRRSGDRPGDPWTVPGWAAFVGLVTLVAVAAPAFGSDVGGTLAVAPAFALLLTLLTGRRVSWRGVIAALVIAVGLVGVLAFVDLQRPAASRTHLGRFLDRLIHGDGGVILRRKLQGNVTILTGSVWSLVLGVLIVAALVVTWRRRDRVRAALADRRAVSAFLAASGVMALLGFALNDSGIAVPAAMFTVAIPWVVAMLVPVVKRAR